MGSRRVVYARINRRIDAQSVLQERSFHDDMMILARAESFHAAFGEREWFATDVAVDPSETFMTGVVGYMSVEKFRHLDEESPSWKKAPETIIEGASRTTLTAFGIDLREDRRWVAFAPTHRIQPTTFSLGFKVLLESAVTTLGLMPAEWDIDLIPSTTRVIEWLRENQDVSEFIRVVKRPNPGRVIDEDIERLRRMAAKTKHEKYVPFRSGTLDLADQPELVEELLSGSQFGNVEVIIKTRSGRSTFRSRNEIEEGRVDDWGDDWELATEWMLEAVRLWSEGAAEQQRFSRGEQQER